jgi:hypothetical protein
MKEELEKASAEFTGDALSLVESFEIRSPLELKFAEDERAFVKKQWADYEVKRKKATGPLNESLREINGWFKPVQTALKNLEQIWNDKLLTYAREQAQERQRLLVAAQTASEPAVMREALIAASEAAPQNEKTTYIDHWVWEITEEADIPREYMSPDPSKINAIVSELKGTAKIPGVRVFNQPYVKSKRT